MTVRTVILIALAGMNGVSFVLHAFHGCWLDASLDAAGIVACGILWDRRERA